MVGPPFSLSLIDIALRRGIVRAGNGTGLLRSPGIHSVHGTSGQVPFSLFSVFFGMF